VKISPAEISEQNLSGLLVKSYISRETVGAERFRMGLVTIAPEGETVRNAHPAEEALHILTGKGKIEVDSTWYEFQAGDWLYVPFESAHKIVNTGSAELVYLFAVCPPVGADQIRVL
jgi:quercetin dioxygenase-like cupin family protein